MVYSYVSNHCGSLSDYNFNDMGPGVFEEVVLVKSLVIPSAAKRINDVARKSGSPSRT